jgi:hypothetical protein
MSEQDSRTPSEDTTMAVLGEQIDAVGRGVERSFDPGGRALVAAVAVLVLLGAAALPWVGSVAGWELLLGQTDASKVAGIAPRVFLAIGLTFGVVGTMAALAIRRYGAAWVTSLGCDLGVLFGALSIWSQQTSSSHQPGPGPGVGIVLAEVAMLVLAGVWAGIAWKRPPAAPGESARHGGGPPLEE